MAKIEDKSECLTQSNFSIQGLKLCIGVKVGRERRRNFLLSRGKAPSVGSWCEDCAGGAVRPRSSWVGCSRVRVNWRDGYDRFVRAEPQWRACERWEVRANTRIRHQVCGGSGRGFVSGLFAGQLQGPETGVEGISERPCGVVRQGWRGNG